MDKGLGAEFKYERLTDLCYRCRRLDHKEKTCKPNIY